MANLSNINGKFVVEQTTGYVGVGTTDPNYPIEVLSTSAEIALNASGGSIYRVQSDSASNFIIRKEGVGDRLVINSGGKIVCANVGSDKKIAFRRTGGNNFSIEHDSASIYFYNESTSSVIFKMANNNNVTFAGTVTAAGGTMTADTTFNSNIILEGNIFHKDDTNTYFGFNSGSSTDDTIVFATSNVQRLIINSSGNIGIGVVPYLSSLPNTVIDINPVASVWGYGNSVYLNANAYYNSGWLYKTTAAAGVLQVEGNLLRFRTAASGTAGAAITFDVPFFIDTTGNVGIGTDQPLHKLSIRSTDNTRGILINNTSTASYAELHLKANREYRIGTGGSATAADAANNFYVYDATAGLHRLTLLPSGNVGIGSDSPNQKLQVNGKAIIGTSANLTSGAGALSVNSVGDNNGGIVDTHSNGGHRYYTRVCHAATSSGSAGYWHIKTNIPIDSSVMFLAKFYGYIYGQAGITDLQHGGYAYNNGSGGAVINQVVTNNSSNTGMSSAVYTSTTGNLLCFRIDLNGSTYYAGLWMDIGFQNPTGGSWNFNIEGTTFNATANYY